MNINPATRALIRRFEGCRLKAYQCSAKVWTIGWGNTFYQDGSSVKQGDVITQERADQLFIILLDQFAAKVRPLIKQPLNDNQFGALLSFAYNCGVNNLAKSTLLRIVNENPSSLGIAAQFKLWNKAGGKVLLGLTRRRTAEADLYFTLIQ
jgi:lysozyme